MSRRPPPHVPPISYAGTRYEQVKNPASLGFTDPSGYLTAIDEASGERLWVLKVYENPIDERMELDVQHKFFKAMTLLSATRQIQIINEANRRFLVDLDKRSVRELE